MLQILLLSAFLLLSLIAFHAIPAGVVVGVVVSDRLTSNLVTQFKSG
jgi:Ca2+/Na+ antiporter